MYHSILPKRNRKVPRRNYALTSAVIYSFNGAGVKAFTVATVNEFTSAVIYSFNSAVVKAFTVATVNEFTSAVVKAFTVLTQRSIHLGTWWSTHSLTPCSMHALLQ